MDILLLDDHSLIRDALSGVLKAIRPQARLLEAADGAAGLRLIEAHPGLAMVLLDLGLPDRDGFALLAELRERFPEISVVVLSATQDRDTIVKALDAGALGFIPKSATRDILVSALNLIFAGGIFVPPEALGPPQALAGRKQPERTGASPAALGLTDRQIEVLALVMRGKSNKAICRALDLAEPTVKNHMTAILKALNVTNRTEAVIAARERGWDLPVPADAPHRRGSR